MLTTEIIKNFLKNNIISVFFIFITLLTTLVYALTTNHIWEDFFITFRYSKNLVDGYGLVYQQNERIHGFTSVINTLLPAFFYWITGKSFISTIWLFRISSIIALIAGSLYLIKEIQKHNQGNLFIPVFFALFVAFQTKTIMFATNGQEAGFMMLFLLPSLVFAFNGYRHHWGWAGLCWAGLIYTRPDGVVYILLLVIASYTFGKAQLKSIDDLKATVKVALVCAALYLPWFIFVWVYYGTPIPHTVIAKAGLGSNFFDDVIFSLQAIISFLPSVGILILEPTYFHFGGWPYWIKVFSFIGWIVSTVYWLIPSDDRFGRFVSFIYTLLIIYFCLLQFRASIFPWYYPPAAIISVFVLSSALFHLPKKLFKHPLIPAFFIGVLLLFSLTNIYFMTINQISIQQQLIETGNRKQIGLWLKNNINDNDTVFLEPLGYIGYYSNAKMYDWPGLVSHEVVSLGKIKDDHPYSRVINTLKPDWLVLRPQEAAPLLKNTWFEKKYKAVKIFSVKDRLARYKYIPGRNYLIFDSEFYIFKKI